MNLGEAKQRVLKLLDEYTSNGEISVDLDMEKKMNAFFDMGQIDVSRIKGIVKRYDVPLLEHTDKPYVEYPMPEDFERVIRVWADLQLTDKGRWIGKSLILPADEKRQITVEYFALPQRIDEQTPDEYEFELEPDAQDCLIYFVAAQQLMSDLIMDNGRLLGLYQRKLDQLAPSYEMGSLEIIPRGPYRML